MPLDMNVLYGEMGGSALAHFAIPILIGLALPILNIDYLQSAFYLLAGIVIMSFVVHWLFILGLQASSCKGVKDVLGITYGSIGATFVTLLLTVPAIYSESFRLLISQVFIRHKPLEGPDTADLKDKIIKVAVNDGMDSVAATEKATAEIAGMFCTKKQYEAQTLLEMRLAAAFMAAWTGAYGVGIGSMLATNCNPSG
jgi:hypothetical protein